MFSAIYALVNHIDFSDNISMDAEGIKQVYICNKSADTAAWFMSRLMNVLKSEKRITVIFGECLPENIFEHDVILYISEFDETPPVWTRKESPAFFLVVSQTIYDRFGADIESRYNYTFISPADGDLIAHRILKLLFSKNDTEPIYSDQYFTELEHRAGRLLKSLGVPLRLDGFYYLRFALAYSYLKPDAVWKTDIYPKIAMRFKKNAACAERSMRYAIEYAWTHGDINAQHKIFGYTIDLDKGKPVLRELTATLADRMRLETSCGE